MYTRLLLPQWLSPIIALFAGALFTLSLAPYGQWPLGLVSVAVLAWLLADGSARSGFLLAWCYGTGTYLSGASWVYVSIHVYGYAAPPLAAALTLLFCVCMGLFIAVPCYAYCRWLRGDETGRRIGFASTWLVTEWLRSWLFTGFPWLFLGHGHSDSYMAAMLPTIGSIGLGLLLAYVAATLASLCRKPDFKQQWPAILTAGFLLMLPLAYAHRVYTEPADKAVQVTAIQANIPQEQKWQREQLWPSLREYESLSQAWWQQDRLLIWPEAAVPNFYHRMEGYMDSLSKKAEASGTHMLTGIPIKPDDNTAHNGIAVLNGHGDGGIDFYYKQRLVPFGEYVPLQAIVGSVMKIFELPMSDFKTGPTDQPPLAMGDWLYTPAICYEITYDRLIARSAKDSHAIITISNDAWFGRSIGPIQHLQIARIRAIENAKPVIRATGSGITAVIDHKGKIVEQIPAFETAVMNAEFTPRIGATPFSNTGGWPAMLVAAIGIGLAARSQRRQTRES